MAAEKHAGQKFCKMHLWLWNGLGEKEKKYSKTNPQHAFGWGKDQKYGSAVAFGNLSRSRISCRHLLVPSAALCVCVVCAKETFGERLQKCASC